MSEIDLTELDELYARATPGEWQTDNPDDDMCMNAITVTDGRSRDLEQHEHNIAITLLQTPLYADVPQYEENAEWIAQSHNAYPALREALLAARADAEAGRRYVAALIEAMDAEAFCELVETGRIDGIRAWLEGRPE